MLSCILITKTDDMNAMIKINSSIKLSLWQDYLKQLVSIPRDTFIKSLDVSL